MEVKIGRNMREVCLLLGEEYEVKLRSRKLEWRQGIADLVSIIVGQVGQRVKRL